jgi:hypothetical protein
MNPKKETFYSNQSANEFVVGSIIREGHLHKKISLGCQDAKYTSTRDNIKIGVVCDGCSTTESGLTQNQVGAALGAQFIGSCLTTLLKPKDENEDIGFEKLLYITRSKTNSFFLKLCKNMNLEPNTNERREFILNKLLFTVIGIVIVGDLYWIFGLGDGCYGVENKIEILTPTPTPYLNQSLLEKSGSPKYQFEIYEKGSADKLNYLWIATDGLAHFLSNPYGKNDFYKFLDDELTCETNRKGEDTTIQAFNRNVYTNHKLNFSDDVAMVLIKKVKNNNSFEAREGDRNE